MKIEQFLATFFFMIVCFANTLAVAGTVRNSFPIDDLTTAKFKFDLGSFVFYTNTENKITITISLGKLDAKCQPTITKENDLFVISALGENKKYVLCQLKGEIGIPKGLEFGIQLDNGDLSVSGFKNIVGIDMKSGTISMSQMDGIVKINLKQGKVIIDQSKVTGTVKVEVGGIKVGLSGIPTTHFLELELGKGLLEMQIPRGIDVRPAAGVAVKSIPKDTQTPVDVDFVVKTKLDSGELIIRRMAQ